MKNIFARISGLVGSLFLATAAFAWTPTVEVVRDSNNVLLRVSGWPTAAQFGEIDWNTYNVKIMIANQALDITGGVAALFLSSHPAITASIGNSFDLSIALNPYFGIDPTLYPVRLRVCKQAIYGGQCADSEQSFVKRKPQDTTADTIGYPSPLLAACSNLPGGRADMEPHAAWYDTTGIGAGTYGVTATEVYLDKATTITGFTAMLTNAATNGVATPTNLLTTVAKLNVYSSLTNFAQSPFNGDVINRAPMTFQGIGQTLGGFCVGIFNNYNAAHFTIMLQSPITLAPGYYVFSPRLEDSTLYYTNSMVDLGTDYGTEQMNPGVYFAANQIFPGQTGTSAFNILGY